MLAFRRTFYVEKANETEGEITKYEDLFQAVSESLQTTLVELLPDDWNETVVDGWPNIHRKGDDGRPQLEMSLWEPKSGQAPRLLEMTLEVSDWRIELAIGQSGDNVVIYEKAHWAGPGREIPLSDYPELVRFLRPFEARNIEGYKAKVIPLRKEKVQDFIDFLKSPDRQMPVVFYTSPHRTSECNQPKAKQVQEQLWGLAYVVEAQDRETVDLFNQFLSSHSTYNGAIRIYMPRFQPSDSSRHHPFWPCNKGERAFQEILSDVARESILSGLSDEIASLRKRREEYQRNEAIRLRQETLRSRQTQVDSHEWEEMVTELDKQCQQLREEKELLEAETATLRDKNRQLEWRLRQQWKTQDDLQQETTEAPQLLLSEKAWDQFRSMSPDEQRYWERHIFPKLMDQELRDNQSEPISGSKGDPTWVYPRHRTHDGRRVVYYKKSRDVYACELFPANEHDQYNRLRNEGPDRETYVGFSPWTVNEENGGS